MPTENRSSNTEMVSVPREHKLKIRQTPLADLLSGLKTGEVRDCSDREFAVGDTVLLREIDDSRDYTGTVLRRNITHVQKHYGLPDHLCVLSYGQPAPQTHPEPIAWMVGTAFWWTKEEAERDAAETGLPIVGLGPMTASIPAEQSQGTPVGEVVAFGKGLHEIAWAAGRMPKLGAKLYTHADPGEVERLRERGDVNADRANKAVAEGNALRAQLADRDALLRDFLEVATGGFSDSNHVLRVRRHLETFLSASAEPEAT
ncbi:DUF3850 domain-containing protein [Pseudomonas kurunegalensis]|uniref:DUF3850 domain-containing protein n=1 Tax=Pseudomonas kurunegalensis TaxID=485880 RepID=UPI003A8644B9